MAEGIARCGDSVELHFEDDYTGANLADVGVFYGLEGNMPRVFADYRARGRAVYVDLGYWGRREGGRWTGYHKIAVNARHPTAYYRTPQHDPSRVRRFGLKYAKWTGRGAHIVLAGMGDKGARAEGYAPEAWERWVLSELRRYTDRPIVYRPKPSWKAARPIDGTRFSSKAREMADELANCWAVVTHHSNVAVEAQLAGVPTFCWYGVGAEMSLQDLSRIESPRPPDDSRAAWCADIAWCQWSVDEMRSGEAWKFLRAEGLV